MTGKTEPTKIICVTRGTEIGDRIRSILGDRDVNLVHEKTLDRVLERFESETFDILVISSAAFRAGKIDGIELVEIISAKSPTTQILFLADARDVRTAMSLLKAGSYQYAKVPVGDEELRLLIETAIDQRPRYGTNLLLTGEQKRARFQTLIGRSLQMQNVYRQIRQAAATDIPVLLTGETGTGKDLAAKAIHRSGERRDGPYLPVNLGAVPHELVASELFGHAKGSFTGATEPREGIFEQGRDGTVFLDEISAIDEKVQVSLLRLIEHKRFHRLGGRRRLRSNARLIAASNEDLQEEVKRGTFREDLYFRLDVFHIVLPPLRDRPGDVALLIDEFLQRYNDSFQKNILGISPGCVSVLQDYDWPGNVRELKNVIQRAVLVCTGEVLLPEHLPPRLRPDRQEEPRVSFEIGTPLHEVEREMIVRSLTAAGNNRKRTAELLGISRRALYNKLEKYGIK
jgi:DNA-binding NtrC family response regulator